MTDITVLINGEDRSLPSQLTIEQMLEALDLPRQRVAIELNQKVLPRSEWPQILVRDRDRIEVVHFVGGG